MWKTFALQHVTRDWKAIRMLFIDSIQFVHRFFFQFVQFPTQSSGAVLAMMQCYMFTLSFINSLFLFHLEKFSKQMWKRKPDHSISFFFHKLTTTTTTKFKQNNFSEKCMFPQNFFYVAFFFLEFKLEFQIICECGSRVRCVHMRGVYACLYIYTSVVHVQMYNFGVKNLQSSLVESFGIIYIFLKSS